MPQTPPSRRIRAPIASLAATAALILLVFARGAALAEQPLTKVDMADNRIVSIGGSVTEIVYLLGAADRLIAVDSTSLYPPEAQDQPDVGYMRRLAAEPILALRPTLLLAVEDAGPPSVLEQLRAAGTRLVTVPDDPTPEGVLKKISVVADALDLEAEGQALAARLEKELQRLREALAAVERKPSVLFLFSVGRGAPLAAGRDNSADSIIALAGGRNAVDRFDGYKPLSPEAAVAAAPEVLLVTERTLRLLGGRETLLTRPEVSATPAGHNGRVVVMDGLLLLGFGPRTPSAIRQLATALHPDLTVAPAAR